MAVASRLWEWGGGKVMDFGKIALGSLGTFAIDYGNVWLKAGSSEIKVGSDSGFQSPPIFGDFPFPPPFFPFFSVIFSCKHALL